MKGVIELTNDIKILDDLAIELTPTLSVAEGLIDVPTIAPQGNLPSITTIGNILPDGTQVYSIPLPDDKGDV